MSTKSKNVVVNGNSHGGGEASGRSSLDLQYREFLENFRESSYSLVLKLDDDLELEYKYEQETCTKTQESSKKHANHENSEARRNPRVDLGSKTRKNPKKRRLNSSEVREEAEMEENDLEWDEFLKNHRNDEEDESSSSDVMILSPEEVPRDFETSKPSFVIDLDGDDCPVDNGDCEFRRKLIEKLKMPFDAKQYQMFFQEVNIRRPKTSEKMLRGRDVDYTTQIICESYLERYPDFAEKINSAEGDKPRILNLLRGFVFWLRNSVTVGSFKPWLDPLCLKILPCHGLEDSEVLKGLTMAANASLDDLEMNETYNAYLKMKGLLGGTQHIDNESPRVNVENQTNDVYSEDGPAYVVEVEGNTREDVWIVGMDGRVMWMW